MQEQYAGSDSTTDVVVVGAGFAGLYMLHRLRALGLATRVIEAGSGVGGTWYWNRYPGARCDTESMQYSYSFSPELEQAWEWSEKYAGQPEILRYANHVADRFDLRRDITLATRVVSAQFDEASERWSIRTDGGETIAARWLVMATGCLSNARMPNFPGADSFAGAIHHTGHWPDEPVDFASKRVAVIGTGSSGIQIIPVLAEHAAHVTVFQRTPNFSIPARNRPMTADYERSWKREYPQLRERARDTKVGILNSPNDVSAVAVSDDVRRQEYETRWASGGTAFMAAFNDLLSNEASNTTAADFVRAQIRAIVRDPAVAERLSPRDYPIGTKRVCADTDYFATFNRANVSLVDLRESPLERVVPEGIVAGGVRHDVDMIVCATGFDAMTGALLAIDIRGRDGMSLRDKWAAGPRTYLGLTTSGFPNLFMITGPGSPSVLSNMIVSIEQHVEWVSDCLAHVQRQRATVIEPTLEAEDGWVEHVNEVASRTLFPRAASWYMGANVPGKPRVFMPYIGGFGAYRRKCAEVAAAGYAGFSLSGRNA